MHSESPFPWFALNVRTSGEALDPRPYSDRIKTARAALFPGY